MTGHELLSVAEMYAADKSAEASGVPSEALMEAAGRGISRAILRRFPRGPVAVLAGPGNNGGDGFVVARLLQAAGWPVRLALLGAQDRLGGDAALNASRWDGPVEPLSPAVLDGASLVVDALFGAGLTRRLEGIAAKTVEAVAARGIPVVAVDVPSGVHGDTGAVFGTAAPAVLTVTFFRRKPGHLLLPGRDLCGRIEVVDIGIPQDVLAGISPATFANEPALWLNHLPWPKAGDHKYTRGHAVVCGGFPMTGAARLAARAARRAGAGLLTIAAPPDGVAAFQADWPGAIVAPVADAAALAALLDDPRRNAVLVGPGGGTGGRTREAVLAALARGKATVLDADALTTFADNPAPLFDVLNPRCVLTPHEGEYGRLFGAEGDRLSRARAAAAQGGAVVVLKGSDTVVAAPDGRAAINGNAPPTLATGGSGDVLAGLILGLLAQGVPAWEAAAAAVWMQGDSAARFGPGLIAEDIVDGLPAVLASLAPASFGI